MKRNQYEKETKQQYCCICGQPIYGYGNNAEPYCEGRCCDDCNFKFVIPYRIMCLDDEQFLRIHKIMEAAQKE